MEPTIQMFLIVCPMVFLASFVDAIAGGGGLISLPAYLLSGVPVHYAVATNKLSSATGTSISTFRLCKNGFVDWPLAVPSIIASLIGSAIGANIALQIDAKVFKLVLVVILPVVAYYVLKQKNFDHDENDRIPRKRQYLIVAVASFFIGGYDGFYGPGTGTFLILVYTGLAKMNIRETAGNTKLVNLASNVSSLAVYLFSGNVLVSLGLAASIFSIAGHYLGAGTVMKNGSKIVRPIVLIVVSILFIKTIIEML